MKRVAVSQKNIQKNQTINNVSNNDKRKTPQTKIQFRCTVELTNKTYFVAWYLSRGAASIEAVSLPNELFELLPISDIGCILDKEFNGGAFIYFSRQYLGKAVGQAFRTINRWRHNLPRWVVCATFPCFRKWGYCHELINRWKTRWIWERLVIPLQAAKKCTILNQWSSSEYFHKKIKIKKKDAYFRLFKTQIRIRKVARLRDSSNFNIYSEHCIHKIIN